MITFPCCKINLGLNIVEKRPDGYHNLETVFYPIPLYDALEVKLMHESFPCKEKCTLSVTGNAVGGNPQDNLVVKAYNLIAENYDIPRVHIHLHKAIPSQAGLGGGSADAAYMIRLLDERFRLNMGIAEMERFATKLGADCPFFITAEPSYATGIGEELKPIANEKKCNNYLEGKWIALVKPDIAISTKEAFANIHPQKPKENCRDIVLRPVSEWRDALTNDFEGSLFPKYPELAAIKEALYNNGALYAQMSGSGSTVFGIYEDKPSNVEDLLKDCEVHVLKIKA